MLKDSIDFDYNINKLKEELDLQIQLQDDLLDSEKFNATLESIEKNLNTLYEKTRYLEDAMDYIKMFLGIKIDEYSNNLNSIINNIEDIKKSTKNMGYIEYSVPFIENTFSIVDRNKNYKVEPCLLKESLIKDIKSKLIILNNRVNTSYKYNSLLKKCQQVAYDNNLNDLISGKEYKSIYIEEKPIDNGICEEITIYLNEPCEINQLNINTVNSSVQNIRYVYANSIEESAQENVTGIELESRVVTHIKFDLVCKNYDLVQYELDTSLVTENIWNDIKMIEYPTTGTDISKMNTDVLVSRTETTFDNIKTYKAYKAAPDKITKLNMYIYSFGIDKLEINRIVQYEDGYFVSDPINVGDFNNGEYIQLNVEDNIQEGCSIEYYVLDGDIQIPIMPINYNYISNERIFPEENLRFTVDYDVYGDGLKQIKKDGINVSISLDDAKTQYDGRYSADYLPILEYYKYTPLNSSVKVKAIIRTFGDVISSVPYIKNISIRKFGGNSLWTTLY